MIQAKECFPEAINSPVRKIGARVELFEGSTLIQIFQYTDALKSFTVERIGDEGKFFGFGVCQKLNVKLIDKDRKLNITTANTLEIEFGVGCEFMYPYPAFYVTEVHRDENTNELSITAYDKLYAATAHTVSELDLPAGYDIKTFTTTCAAFLGLPVQLEDNPAFDTYYPTGANFEGTETLREALDDVAEATQTVYYINYNWDLMFKRPDVEGDPVLIVGKDKYIELDSKTNRRLSDICSATELGDNITTTSGIMGTTQYVRDNAFWELRDDIDVLLNNALTAIGGMTINQFNCSWRGDFTLEIGDKIGFVTKDDKTVYSYIFNDSLVYDGFLGEKLSWEYAENDEESADNPVTLGEALKKTFARVDKANQQIDIVAGETAAIKLDNKSIQASVTELDNNLSKVVSEVNTKMTAEDVSISIQTALENGVESVTTTTGFTFNQEGLHISKTGSEINTTITEDGMTVRRENNEVLVADNLGVRAEDLHATTFLIIGVNSRFEDYAGGSRTGCFWIGR